MKSRMETWLRLYNLYKVIFIPLIKKSYKVSFRNLKIIILALITTRYLNSYNMGRFLLAGLCTYIHAAIFHYARKKTFIVALPINIR